MEDPHTLWHTQQDHLHHTNAVQGLSRKGDLRHRTVIQLPDSNRGATRMPALTATLYRLHRLAYESHQQTGQ